MAATLPTDAKQHEAQQAADQTPAPEPAPAKRTARRQWSIQGKALYAYMRGRNCEKFEVPNRKTSLRLCLYQWQMQ